MPTYAYECAACGHRFEEFQTMTAAPLRKCPSCAKPKLQRLIGAGAGVIFKGSGFYETDYKKSANGNKAGDKADGKPGEKGTTEKQGTEKKSSEKKGGESKPAAGAGGDAKSKTGDKGK